MIEQLKTSQIRPNSLGEIDAINSLLWQIQKNLAEYSKKIASNYIKKRIKEGLDKTEKLKKMIIDNQKRERNPLLDKREWK